MLDSIRKVLERTKGNSTLRRVSRACVRLGLVRHHNLHIALGTERSRLEEWFAVDDALRVHVETRLNVVERVADSIEWRVKLRVELMCLTQSTSNDQQQTCSIKESRAHTVMSPTTLSSEQTSIGKDILSLSAHTAREGTIVGIWVHALSLRDGTLRFQFLQCHVAFR